ncbi:protein toll-like [Ostrinia furnacalis]|uniref:protein toll-like n=1 Tax=Ostrinia furnacalis TaxID=93504 RepID=UPI00103FEA34|nr:protein toll-like [Ostrinia furnacalis]XP_028174939.1 protein toll-like [Ostrinia furnacalis]
MGRQFVYVLASALALQIIGASTLMCPSDPNCVCGGTLAVELNCNIDGRIFKINLLPNTYINIKCENTTSLDYSRLPKCANVSNLFKSVSFKDCPIPLSSFKDVLTTMGVSKTMALIFQNAKNLSGYFDRKHFAGLQDLTKLLLSINGVTHLPDNLFADINKLTWLNIRSNSINLTEQLFKPLERLETLEISHNHMTNISSNLFSHLSFLRKLSLWQSNVTWFSKDFFTGVDVLEELDLSSNGLNELPGSIFKPLRKLKKLTLFSNKFSSLPQSLFKTNDELETVVILNNDVKLQELPKYLFGNLPNLKLIYIQRCGLERVPYDVFADSPSVTNISLAYNDIKSLPESVFNDQINLLELDLSHNKLDKLESKLFSSLVRLEKLDLRHNSLVEISGATFSSLLSLIYLNMENNSLKVISSYLFSNNKQKMSISLAYNKLDFEHKELINNSWVVNKASPFAHTYNLRLLNLSHNEFRTVFDDWWINGHDHLDISYNYIKNLWDGDHPLDEVADSKRSYQDFFKKPLKEVWISHNPLSCECQNFYFLDFLDEHTKTKVIDIHYFKCHIWSRETCYTRFTIFISIITVIVSLYIIVLILFITYRKQVNSLIKKKLSERKHKKNTAVTSGRRREIVVRFCESDEEFVLKEILPELKGHKGVEVQINPINNLKNNQFIDSLKMCVKEHKHTTLVVFSPNYLTSTYSHVDIKKIHGEMLKAENTVYVFADVGPENSIYAFLKEQRDERTSVVWSEADFWKKFLRVVSGDMKKDELRMKSKYAKAKAKLPSNISFSRLPDWSSLNNVNTFTHSHV